MFQMAFMKRFAKGLNPLSNQGGEYWQQEYHWHKQVESDDHRSVMYGLTEEDKQRMNKTEIAKMDMEAFRQMKELEEQLVEFNKRLAIAEFERDRWKAIAEEQEIINSQSYQGEKRD